MTRLRFKVSSEVATLRPEALNIATTNSFVARRMRLFTRIQRMEQVKKRWDSSRMVKSTFI